MPSLRALPSPDETEDPEIALLDRVFFALSDPVRRQILERLEGHALLVSELAAPFAISLQAVCRHIQVLVRAGLVPQERTIPLGAWSLDAGQAYGAAASLTRYASYWQPEVEPLG